MTTLLTDRRFGVEIECGMPDGCEQAEQLLYDAGGLRHWVEGQERYNEYTGRWEGDGGGHIHEDGSGVELSSPILQGVAGLNELRRVLKLLSDNGGYVTERDGMHVHHDAPEFVNDHEAVVRIVEMWTANQSHIDKLVHIRRRDNGACIKNWNDMTINELKRGHKGYTRGALNVRALDEHGTIEFRQHEGTLDFPTALSWIQFGQSFMASALRRKTDALMICRTPKDLLWRIRTDREAATVLLAKETEGAVPTPNEKVCDPEWCDCDDCYEARYGVDLDEVYDEAF